MTTFQAIVIGVVYGLSFFLPISASAHHWLISYLVEWPPAHGPFLGAVALAGLLALLVFFRHDWASIFSSFLQVVLFWKKPKTLDERLPFFILITGLPAAIVWFYFFERVALEATPIWIAGSLIFFTIPLLIADRINRQTKSMLNWNWLDALVVGFTQLQAILPGAGRQAGALVGGLFRNYNRESAAKYSLFSLAPILLVMAIQNLKGFSFSGDSPMPNVSWLSFIMGFAITFGTSLLAIGGLMKNISSRTLSGYVVYRLLIGLMIVVIYWIRSR